MRDKHCTRYFHKVGMIPKKSFVTRSYLMIRYPKVQRFEDSIIIASECHSKFLCFKDFCCCFLPIYSFDTVAL